MEVKLGKFVVKLQKPTSFMSAREVTIAVGVSALRGLGAALGVCWSGKPLKATLAGCKYDTLAYGGAVVDELVALGVTEAERSRGTSVEDRVRLSQWLALARIQWWLGQERLPRNRLLQKCQWWLKAAVWRPRRL
jgi:hypothetical protein